MRITSNLIRRAAARPRPGDPREGCARLVVVQAAAMVLCIAAAALGVGGCTPAETPAAKDVTVSLLNVTAFEAQVLVSGVVGAQADVGTESVPAMGSTGVTFACLDELIIGDAFDLTAAGAHIQVDADTEIALDPFALWQGQDFGCGDIIEVIISGDAPTNLALNVFVLTPP